MAKKAVKESCPKALQIQKELESVSKKLTELYELTGLDKDGEKARKEAGVSEPELFFMIHQRDALELYMFCMENRLNYVLSQEGQSTEGEVMLNGNC